MEQPCTARSHSQHAADWAEAPVRWILWRLPLGLAVLGWIAGPWRWPLWSVALLWMGIACGLNAKRCGRVHCTFTAPLYGLLGLVAGGRAAGWLEVAPGWPWLVAIAGTLISFIPEWLGRRYWKPVG